MVREKNGDSDDEEIYDVQVTGTSLQLKKVDKPAPGAAGGTSCGAADSLAAGVDAALFLDDDVELPSDEDD